MVTLGQENRLFGADSLLESGKYPRSSFREMARTFGQLYDAEKVAALKEHRYIFNELVEDERGQIGYSIVREAYGKEEAKEQLLHSEEVVAMMFATVKSFAEKQAEGAVRDCVITVPSWYTYDQRLMIKDAAELANLKVLQLVHENVAAAVMFGIDQKLEADQTLTVLFYNMGGMDTEVTIARYSMFNVTEKKSSPYIEILAETSVPELGGVDIDLVIFNILADKFNALPERAGKPDCRENKRAVSRLLKESTKIKEILSANKFASVKVPELIDYVTLQFNLEREVVEAAAESTFAKVRGPADEALEKAGLTIDDIDQVELLGGGIRVPKVTEILQDALGGKELSVHLNGDEAMCFGSAFIASNSSTNFKVKQVFLTQHP